MNENVGAAKQAGLGQQLGRLDELIARAQQGLLLEPEPETRGEKLPQDHSLTDRVDDHIRHVGALCEDMTKVADAIESLQGQLT